MDRQETLDTMETLTYRIERAMYRLHDLYEEEIRDDPALVYAFNDKYPFVQDFTEVYYKTCDWELAMYKKLELLDKKEEE